MNNIIKRVWNQNRLVNIEGLTGMVFQAEDGGHTFEISGIDDTGAAVELSGTVTGVFRRPDNADIALTGSASDGVVSVTLSEYCYAVPGRFGLTIFVTSNSQKAAVYACVGTVAVSSTGNVAGDTPANVEDLIDDINAAIADLNSAIGQIPASYANVMAAIAPTYSSSALYPVGSYAWYDGALYRCTTAITTAEAWTAGHWTAAVPGDDVGDLKRAINELDAASNNVNIKMGWRVGDMSNGSYNPLNYRICSGIVTFPNAVMFRCRDGYQLYTVSYKSDGTVDKSISFRVAIQIPANLPFSLTIRKNPESTSTPAVLADFIAGVYLDAYTGTGDYPIFERGNLTQPSNPGQRATSALIPGKVGRISIRADGYDHYLEPYTLDGTQLSDTAWVSGSADYSLDPNKNYIVVFAVTGARTTPIDFSDLSPKVAIYRVTTGMPDMLTINADKIPLIQQTFVGRPTMTGATDSVLSFLWFSDIHKEQKQWDRSILLANYYQRNFAFAIHTGDYVGTDQSSFEMLYQNGVTPSIPMLNVVGNHDIYTNFANRTIAEKSVTKGIIMPDTTAWGVTWGDGTAPMNYYKDFAAQKIRLVVLDDYYDTETQTTWLATVLSDAQALGYHVITAAHETSRPITTWSDNTFCSKDAAALTTGGLNHSATPYDAVIKAFKDGGGIHIAHICGHEHVDLMGKSANGVLNIVIGSQHGYYADASDAMRIKETVTEDLVNVVGVNTNLGLIKLVRVGVNTDHYLRGRNILCYDYLNDIAIANW